MPSSGSGRLISGSWTVASAAFTASSAGDPVSVSDMRDVSPSTGSLRCGTRTLLRGPRVGVLPLYGAAGGPLRRAAVTPAAPQEAQLSRRPVLGPAGPLPRLPRVPTSARTATLRDAVGLGAAVGLYGVAFGA